MALPYNQQNFMQPSQFYPQHYRYEQPQQMILKGRPVASIEEARASMIDFDGSTFYFPDAAKKNIYAKRINMDGTSSLDVYTLQEKPQVPETQYVTMETFQSTINALLGKIEGKQFTEGAQQTNDEQQFKF